MANELGIKRLPTTAPNALSNAISVVSQAISAEVSARGAGDAAEVSNRSSADTAISVALDVISAARVAEAANRVSADAVLSAAQTVISNALSAEIANRLSAADVLSQAVSGLSSQVSGLSATVQGLSNQVSILSNAVSIVSAAAVFLGPQKAILGGNQTISVSTGVTISGLTIALTLGQDYFFRAMIPFTMAVTTGATFGVFGPATSNFIATTEIPTTGTAQATTYGFGTLGTIGNKISTVSSPLTAVSLLAFIEGFIRPSANGSLGILASPSVRATTPNITVLKGASLLVWRIS